MNKILLRILTDDIGAFNARSVLLKALQSAGVDPLEVTLSSGDQALEATERMRHRNKKLWAENVALRDEIKKMKEKQREADRKSKSCKTKASPSKTPEPKPEPPKPPSAKERRGKRRFIVIRDGEYAFSYRFPTGGSVERKLYTNDEGEAEMKAAEGGPYDPSSSRQGNISRA